MKQNDGECAEGGCSSDNEEFVSACTTAVVGNEVHDQHDDEKRIEVVAFHEEGDVAVAKVKPSNPIADYLSVGADSLVNDVVGFLRRPIVLRTFTWSSSQQPLTSVLSSRINLPKNWLAVPMVLQKLQGFRYFRGDFVIKVQVNAQPFNAGMLKSVFEPFASQQDYTPSNFLNFSGISGYSNVDLDLSTGTASELTIPFMMPYSHFDLVSSAGLMGDFDLLVYSSLTGGADVGGTVWIHAENVSVDMPTGMPLASFGEPGRSRGRAQMKTVGSDKAGVASELKAQRGGGKITRIAKATSGLARELGDVPIIGEAAKAGEWVADAVGGVASVFGFSKPKDEEAPQLVTNTYARHMANYDGDSKAKSLGLASNNSTVVPVGMYGTECDEMSLAYILQRPTFLDRYTFTTSNPADAVLWSWPVMPDVCRTQTKDDGLYKENTYLSFLSESFNYWRGGLQFRFRMVKTNYHSGRVRVFFVPGADVSTNPSAIDVDKCYNQIIDIRNNTEFSFTVPFVNNLPWKQIDKTVQHDTPVGSTPTGMLYVVVLNELIAGASAADRIEFLVEINAAKDFQFAILNDYDHFHLVEHNIGGRGKAQMDFFPTKDMKGYTPNQISIGEAITSLRQCLKRYQPYPDYLPACDDGKVNLVYPYILTVQGSNRSQNLTLLNKWMHMYRMMSGNMRLMITYPHDSTSQSGPVIRLGLIYPYYSNVQTISDNPFVLNVNEPSIGFGGPRQNFFPELENAIEVELPFYQAYPTMPTGVGNLKKVFPDRGGSANAVPFNQGTGLVIENKGSMELYNQIGEDFTFGYLIGPPMTYLPKS